jgi:hypothetical protein
MAVYLVLVPERLRALFFLLLTLAPTAAIAWWSAGQSALMENKVPLDLKMEAAAPLRIYIVVSLLAVSAVFLAFMAFEKKVSIGQSVSRLASRAVLGIAVLAASAGLISFVASRPDFVRYLGDTYTSVSAEKSKEVGAGRLLEVGAAQRWQVWREAVANWEDHPLGGTGAQSFPLVHMMRRSAGTSYMKQAHGLPFSLLSELGTVGFILGTAFVGTLMTVSTLSYCRIREPASRRLPGAVIALMVIYLLHTSFDWDWNMFTLTMAFMLFAGMMAGWHAGAASEQRS